MVHFDSKNSATSVLSLPLKSTGQDVVTSDDPVVQSAIERLGKVINLRLVPFGVDPIISSEQTQEEFADKMHKYEIDVLHYTEASSDTKGPVMPGNYCLVWLSLGRESLSVVKVEKLADLSAPRSDPLDFQVSLLDHTPQEGVSGLFGCFTASKSGKKTLNRSNLVLVNVMHWAHRAKTSKKQA